MTREERTLRRGDGYVDTRARKDGTTAFSARWHDGVKWRSKTFNTWDAAEDHLRDIGRRKRRRTYGPESDDTVADVLNDYIGRGKQRWSANTVATYSLLARQQITPYLGKVRIVALDTPRVQRWIDKLVAEGLSPAVIENARTVLGGACKDEMKFGTITSNPVTGTRAPSRKKAPKTTWTEDEIARVLTTVANDVRLNAFYLLALTSGMRPGELRAVKWGDIDVETGTVTVRRSMTRDEEYHHKIGDTTKTKKHRAIEIPPETVDALRALRADQLRRRLATEFWADLDIVFDRGDGHPTAQQTVANAHTRVCDTAQVRRIRMHDLRHTFATMMLARNVHPKIVADMLGHDSVNTTLDIYSHVSADMQRAASEVLAASILPDRKRRAT